VVAAVDEATYSLPFLGEEDAVDAVVEMTVAAAGCLLLSRVGALVHLGPRGDAGASWLRFRPEEQVEEAEMVAVVACLPPSPLVVEVVNSL
jgi:hypothetical protein